MQAPKTKNGKRGQTTVEYILLLALIVGIFAVVRQTLEPAVMTNVRALIGMAQTEAVVGGKVSGNPDQPHGAYYVDGQQDVQ